MKTSCCGSGRAHGAARGRDTPPAPPRLSPRHTCLQLDPYKWAKRERGEALTLEAVALTEQGQVMPLATSLALYAADLALEHRLSFADALIDATARRSRVPLVTSDNHFLGLPGVSYLPKAAVSEPKP